MKNFDKTISSRHIPADSGADDVTMPGKRNRKPDGKFQAGDLIINRYKVLSELGQGGMGVVYKCFDEISGIEVALKALPPELSHNTLEMEDIKDNFQLVAKLVHQNIAISKNLEKDNSNGNYYLIMECISGEDLRRWLRRKRSEGDLTLEKVLPVVHQVADALDYAHAQRVMHRDIKPGNIMIDESGKVNILDFGLAAQIHTSMTRVSMAYNGTSGTGPYMAPEQWEGRAQNAKTDQYALAVMTYEMLAGNLPFESTDSAVLREAVLKSPVLPITGLPKYANNALLRALSKNQLERFENCSDFVAALSGKKIKAGKTGKKSVFNKWIAAMFVLALLGAGGTGYYFSSKKKSVSPVVVPSPAEPVQSQPEPVFQPAPAPEPAPAAQPAPAPEPAPAAQPAPAPEPAPAPQPALSSKRDREIAALIQENYRLQPRIKNKKALIDSVRYDRRQTFGTYLDILSENFLSGELAWNRNDPVAANKFFKTAEKAADWIIANAPLRQEAEIFQKRTAGMKQTADRNEASKFVPAIYQNAVVLEKQAEKDYEAGLFKKAAENWEAAITAYSRAGSESRHLIHKKLTEEAEAAKSGRHWEKLKKIAAGLRAFDVSQADALTAFAAEQSQKDMCRAELTAARQAETAGNWQQVLAHAAAARKLGAGSDAQKLENKAREQLAPKLDIIARVNGNNVNFKFSSDKDIPSGAYPKKLVPGQKYTFKLTHKAANGELYTGALSFTCDWQELKTFTVPLKKFTTSFPLNDTIRLELVRINAGKFTIGSPEDETGRFAWEPRRDVMLTRNYWIGKFEVTQAQYETIMGKNPSHFKGMVLPVEQVSWFDAQEFCRKLNERFAGQIPAGYKFDLPTEAQWEYACRAGTTEALNNGKNLTDEETACDNLAEIAWYFYTGQEQQTHPVGQKRPNAWQLFDMHGNVWEWCKDWYAPTYGAEILDPAGPADGKYRTLRGGAWNFYAKFCRSASRGSIMPETRSNYIGFRIALVPERDAVIHQR